MHLLVTVPFVLARTRARLVHAKELASTAVVHTYPLLRSSNLPDWPRCAEPGQLRFASRFCIPGVDLRAVGRLAYFSLSHKRRASIEVGSAAGIMVYAAEFRISAA
jgi:hypothetical protein